MANYQGIKVYFLLSLATLGMGYSVGELTNKRSSIGYQWAPVPSLADVWLAPITDLLSTNTFKDITIEPNNEERGRLNEYQSRRPNNLKTRPVDSDQDNEEGEKLKRNRRAFHELRLEQDCDPMLGEPCLETTGCQKWNDCDAEEICIDDDSTRGFTCKRKDRGVHLDIPISWRKENEICELDESQAHFNCIPKGRLTQQDVLEQILKPFKCF